MEYFEDLSMGRTLLPLANPQLRAHCRLWTDHINRKILPSFYSLLLTPPPPPPPSTQMQEQEQMGNGHVDNGDGNGNDSHVNGSVNRDMTSSTEQHDMLIATLQKHITSLVNASHATGPFFLGSEIGYVDVAFAPWIIRLSRVLSYYRNFPRPEVGTRWRSWVDAVESDERVRRTLSEENSYHGVYRGVGEDGFVPGVVGGREFLGGNADPATSNSGKKIMAEIEYARKVVAQEGFGLGGDVWGRLGWEAGGMANGS
jgi:glutathione S-transferase